MKKTNELTVNNILNEIYDIIYDDNLSDIEALETIILVLNEYNAHKESGIIEKKQVTTNYAERDVIKQEKMMQNCQNEPEAVLLYRER